MKRSRGISRFIILIVVLLFTLPFTVTAQENSVETQAILDAETDINRLLWTGVGFTSPFLGCLGCLFGSELASRGAMVSSESIVIVSFKSSVKTLTFSSQPTKENT